MTNPLVSVCIPAYNAANYIVETIACLTLQEYKNLEIIIVDDNSTDATWEVLQNFDDQRIQILKAIGKGAAAARNQAFNASHGDFIIFLDADDLMSSNFIKAQENISKEDLDAVVVSCWGRFFGSIDTYKEDNKIIKKDLTFYEWVIQYWTFCNHTTPPGRIMISRKVLVNAGGWNENLTLNDDFDFFTRIFLESSIIKYNDEGIFYYRSGIGGLSSTTSDAAFSSYFETLKLSLQKVEQQYSGDTKIMLACANNWKMFIYQVYPRQKNLLNEAYAEIKRLGGATVLSPSGGLTKKVENVLGWKLTKKLKTLAKV